MANRNNLNGLNNISNNELPDISLYVGPSYDIRFNSLAYDNATLTAVILHLPKYFRIHGDSPEFVMLLFRLLILYEKAYLNDIPPPGSGDNVSCMSPEQCKLFIKILLKYKIPITDRTIVPITNPLIHTSEYVFVNNNDRVFNKTNIIDRISNDVLLHLYMHGVKFIFNPTDIIKYRDFHDSPTPNFRSNFRRSSYYDFINNPSVRGQTENMRNKFQIALKIKRGYFYRSIYEMGIRSRMPAVIAQHKMRTGEWSGVEHYKAPVVSINTPYRSNNYKKSFSAWGSPTPSTTPSKTANPFSIWGTPVAGVGSAPAPPAPAGGAGGAGANPFSIWGTPIAGGAKGGTRANVVKNMEKSKSRKINKNNKKNNKNGI